MFATFLVDIITIGGIGRGGCIGWCMLVNQCVFAIRKANIHDLFHFWYDEIVILKSNNRLFWIVEGGSDISNHLEPIRADWSQDQPRQDKEMKKREGVSSV